MSKTMELASDYARKYMTFSEHASRAALEAHVAKQEEALRLALEALSNVAIPQNAAVIHPVEAAIAAIKEVQG